MKLSNKTRGYKTKEICILSEKMCNIIYLVCFCNNSINTCLKTLHVINHKLLIVHSSFEKIFTLIVSIRGHAIGKIKKINTTSNFDLN